MRIGQGVDAHPFAGDDRPLWLGGVHIPEGPGLIGHSDGDALLHAVTDAVLGAAGLGDIGALAGVDDPATAGARSAVFVTQAIDLITAAGWEVGNVDCTVMAERPRLSPYRDRLRESVAGLLRVPADATSIKATTADGLGFVGRGEGIVCLAVVLLRRPDGTAAMES